MPASASPRAYDVCFFVDSRPLMRMLDRGVTLDADRIAWTVDGATAEMQFGNVVAVHLKSSGQKVTVDQCTITFSEGTTLTVVNSGPGGYRDGALAASYREFVSDLHARLAAGSYSGNIQFIAGWPAWRYRTTLALIPIAALVFAAGGLAFWLALDNLKGLLLILLGGYLCWTLARRTLANAPRDYTPDRLPEALLS
jgi:hypothetical protein